MSVLLEFASEDFAESLDGNRQGLSGPFRRGCSSIAVLALVSCTSAEPQFYHLGYVALARV